MLLVLLPKRKTNEPKRGRRRRKSLIMHLYFVFLLFLTNHNHFSQKQMFCSASLLFFSAVSFLFFFSSSSCAVFFPVSVLSSEPFGSLRSCHYASLLWCWSNQFAFQRFRFFCVFRVTLSMSFVRWIEMVIVDGQEEMHVTVHWAHSTCSLNLLLSLFFSISSCAFSNVIWLRSLSHKMK